MYTCILKTIFYMYVYSFFIQTEKNPDYSFIEITLHTNEGNEVFTNFYKLFITA